jgi:hypothetical protein
MAWVSEGYQTVVVMAASNGRTINVILKYDATVTTEALAETAYAAWAVDYLAVGTGALKGKSHQHGYYSDAFALPTDPGSEFGERAIVSTTIEGIPTKNATLNIPFPSDTAGVVYVDDAGEQRDVVDTTSTLLAAYIDNWATGALTLSDGEKSAGNIVRGHRAGT